MGFKEACRLINLFCHIGMQSGNDSIPNPVFRISYGILRNIYSGFNFFNLPGENGKCLTANIVG